MRPVTTAFAAALRQPHRRAARVVLLDAELGAVAEITGDAGVTFAGSVTTDSERRRGCQLSIVNADGAWTPSGPGDSLFPNRLVRIDRGIVVAGQPEYVTLGTFVIDRPSIHVDEAGSTISVAGQDRTKLAAKSRFAVPEQYPSGTAIADVVRAIAVGAGMGQTLYRLADGGAVLAADRTFETDSDRWPAIRQLATDYALVAYVDADGYLVLEAAVTPETVPAVSWTFERGAEAIMLGLDKEWSDDTLYNHVRVSGEAADLPPVMAEARDLNPDSPAYNPVDGTGPIGDRLWTYTSGMVRSIEQAQAVADAKLLEVGLVQEQLTVPAVVHPALEVGDAIGVVETTSATADDYLIDSLSIPLGPGAMTITARKLRDLRALAT